MEQRKPQQRAKTKLPVYLRRLESREQVDDANAASASKWNARSRVSPLVASARVRRHTPMAQRAPRPLPCRSHCLQTPFGEKQTRGMVGFEGRSSYLRRVKGCDKQRVSSRVSSRVSPRIHRDGRRVSTFSLASARTLLRPRSRSFRRECLRAFGRRIGYKVASFFSRPMHPAAARYYWPSMPASSMPELLLSVCKGTLTPPFSAGYELT